MLKETIIGKRTGDIRKKKKKKKKTKQPYQKKITNG